MIGINCTAFYLPEVLIDNTSRFGTNKASLNANGFKQLRRALKEESQVEMCYKAFCNLPSSVKGLIHPGVIIVNTSFSRENLPSLAYQLHKKLGIQSNAFCFDVILGCTGFVQTCLIAKSLMREMNISQALIFNVEKFSEILDSQNFSTETIFSDAASVCVLSEKGPWTMSQTSTLNLSEHCEFINLHESKLKMNAGDLYTKLSKVFQRNLLDFLNDNKIELESIDKFLFHQASFKVIEKFRQQLKMDETRIPFRSEMIGNTGSCSIPILLQSYLDTEEKSKRIILSGFGSGLAISHLLLEHKEYS